MKARLHRAEALLSGLAGEEQRWSSKVAQVG
jgi:hypothetical protein